MASFEYLGIVINDSCNSDDRAEVYGRDIIRFFPLRPDALVLPQLIREIRSDFTANHGIDPDVVSFSRPNWLTLRALRESLEEAPERITATEIINRRGLPPQWFVNASDAQAGSSRHVPPSNISWPSIDSMGLPPVQTQPWFLATLPTTEITSQRMPTTSANTIRYGINLKIPEILLAWSQESSSEDATATFKAMRLAIFKYLQKFVREEFERHKREAPDVISVEAETSSEEYAGDDEDSAIFN